MKNSTLLSSFVLTSLISIARPYGLTPYSADLHEATLPAVAIPGNTSQSAGGGCSEASLDGPYGATFSGFGHPGMVGTVTGNAGNVPSAAVGVGNFDGHGNVSLRYTFAEGGNVSTAALTTPDVGTYVVNWDCTAVIYDTTIATQYNMVLIGGGTETFGVLANFTPAFLELKKQNVPAAVCSIATLSGNYAFNLTGSVSPENVGNFNPSVTHEVAEGILTFEGTGTLSASYTLNHDAVVTVVKGDKGKYTVNSDCTGSFTDSTAGLHFNIVIVNGGAELFAIQSDTGYVSLLQAKMQ